MNSRTILCAALCLLVFSVLGEESEQIKEITRFRDGKLYVIDHPEMEIPYAFSVEDLIVIQGPPSQGGKLIHSIHGTKTLVLQFDIPEGHIGMSYDSPDGINWRYWRHHWPGLTHAKTTAGMIYPMAFWRLDTFAGYRALITTDGRAYPLMGACREVMKFQGDVALTRDQQVIEYYRVTNDAPWTPYRRPNGATEPRTEPAPPSTP